jgi:glyoxylase-like metal-dependent hydrolase (beta-lactamase superfamily II)
MIDAPRWNAALVRKIEARGSVRTIFLTHRDDVADAARYAAHFGAERIIHRADRGAMPGAEIVIDGPDPVAFGPFTAIPTPGHTRGHCVVHYGTYLFSGDHLGWDSALGALSAHPSVCWYDWPTQLASVRRLRDVDFTWLLPGHGERVRLDREAMRAALDAVVARG